MPDSPAVADAPADAGAAADSPEQPALPPLLLRDGLPGLIDTPPELDRYVRALAAGTGPIAIDTERASGYRYGQNAYLVQIRRTGAGTGLIDPRAVADLDDLSAVLTGPEWILHAASQDLPCLAELHLAPRTLFDTELAGRLLGMDRVGLGPMVAELLGRSLAKVHGAADWSRRPLPADWLEYAALDVEVLIELREILHTRLAAAGKLAWAEQEFATIRDAPPPPPRTDPWRRTSGMHKLRTRRGLTLVQHLWQAREGIAAQTDTAPGRLLPDSSIVAAARAQVRDASGLRALKEFHGRGARRHQAVWVEALRTAWAVPEADLPPATARGDGPPPPRAWAQRNPQAAARLERARAALGELAGEVGMPTENVLSPDLVRRLMWQPPETPGGIGQRLARGGARPWQIDLTESLLAEAIWPARATSE